MIVNIPKFRSNHDKEQFSLGCDCGGFHMFTDCKHINSIKTKMKNI